MPHSTTNMPEDDKTCASGQDAEGLWTGETWTIAAVSAGPEEVPVDGIAPQFTLERLPGSTPGVYVLKPEATIGLPEWLAPSPVLRQRGAVAPGPLKCKRPLAVPFVKPHAQYWDASAEVLSDERDLLRLEGIIQLSDGPHRIRLYQVNDVLADNKLLLVVDVKSQPSKTNSDGTAIGHN